MSDDSASYREAGVDYDALDAGKRLAMSKAELVEAEAALTRAREDLLHTTIRSPLDGVISQLLAKEGEVVVIVSVWAQSAPANASTCRTASAPSAASLTRIARSSAVMVPL